MTEYITLGMKDTGYAEDQKKLIAGGISAV